MGKCDAVSGLTFPLVLSVSGQMPDAPACLPVSPSAYSPQQENESWASNRGRLRVPRLAMAMPCCCKGPSLSCAVFLLFGVEAGVTSWKEGSTFAIFLPPVH